MRMLLRMLQLFTTSPSRSRGRNSSRKKSRSFTMPDADDSDLGGVPDTLAPSALKPTLHADGVHQMAPPGHQNGQLLHHGDDEDDEDDNDYDDAWFESQEEKDTYHKIKAYSQNPAKSGMATLYEIYNASCVNDSSIDGDPLAGNIYKVFAFGAMNGVSKPGGRKAKKNAEEAAFSCLVPINFLVILLIQVGGPIAILHYYLNPESPAFNCGYGFFTHGQWFQGYTVNNGPQRLLGAGFLMALSLWAVKTADAEKESTVTSMHIFDTFFAGKDGVHGWALFVGALVNSWTLIATVWISFLLLGTAASPGDVLFNSLAVTFLMTLDDDGSDVSPIGDGCWKGTQLEWLKEAATEGDDFLETDGACAKFIEILYSVVHGLMVLNAIIAPILFAGMPWDELQGCEESATALAAMDGFTTTPAAAMHSSHRR
eukprot:gnl/MRDRNA2_/MRDRNA2_85690_c0_seq1.p1 gnl/MRDRNA2_/MRDRNA2_85690_c0~~gnl/MRDRNA2_/MRDRNA2_85690_c0_seq1.p1  ORF type:complete len:428 (-),score=91.37 gnl/MRDRNA2_/MRDRNA2_85690_c0_seq1:609-1892(-)